MATERIRVEVVLALAGRQRAVALELPPGATAAEALLAAGLEEPARAAAGGRLDLGIWGRPVSAARVLADGDRVECYRPLRRDPRAARRRRATRAR